MRHPLELGIAPRDFTDWRGLHALLTECFAYMHGRIDPPSSLTRMSPDDLRTKAAEETLVVLRSRGALVGCGYLKESDGAIYLGKVAVRPAFRRLGGLRMIVEAADDVARERRKPALELETRIELVENHLAFGALGFVRSREKSHPGYDRPTSITMTRPVRATHRPRRLPARHNGGPVLDEAEHVPEWGTGRIGDYFAWRRASRHAWAQPSRDVVLRRLAKARACGITYEEYTSHLLDTGRHLQPSDFALIAVIIARRK